MAHRIIIVGGGFGGITAALKLARAGLKNTSITLISDRPWLEYYGVLYRIIAGSNVSEACLPLSIILGNLPVRVEVDTVQHINSTKKNVEGKRKTYDYDTLILSPGSVPSYFGIPGMEEHALVMKSVKEALQLRWRIIEKVRAMKEASADDRKRLGRFIIIGGGPTGIECGGEILAVAKDECRKQGVNPQHIRVDLIEAMDRLVPSIELAASEKIHRQLERIGMHVHLQTMVSSAEKGSITLKDGTVMKADTILWTAGVQPSPLMKTVEGAELDKRGKVVVDDQLRAKDLTDIFVIGDCASTPFSGMAQTAVEDGVFIARVISALQNKSPLPSYHPTQPAYAIPAGPYWSAVKYGPLRVYGIAGWVMRRLADIHVYMLVIPWRYIPAAFFGRIKLERYGIGISGEQ